MCRSNFTWAVVQNLDEELCRTLAIWSGLQLAAESLSSDETLCMELSTMYLTDRVGRTLHTATAIAMRESVSSGVRSAVFALACDNYKLHTFHSLSELAKVLGWHYVSNTVADMLETNEAPRVA